MMKEMSEIITIPNDKPDHPAPNFTKEEEMGMNTRFIFSEPDRLFRWILLVVWKPLHPNALSSEWEREREELPTWSAICVELRIMPFPILRNSILINRLLYVSWFLVDPSYYCVPFCGPINDWSQYRLRLCDWFYKIHNYDHNYAQHRPGDMIRTRSQTNINHLRRKEHELTHKSLIHIPSSQIMVMWHIDFMFKQWLIM